jgi:hypothetical protein
VHKCGVLARQIRRLDMIGQKFEPVARANLMLVAALGVPSHFLDRVLPDANLTVLDRAKSFDPIVEQVVEPPAETFGLLVSEFADVEERILELPFELCRALAPSGSSGVEASA